MRFGLPFPTLRARPAESPVRIVDLGEAAGPVYAIGDVHGCSALLHTALRGIEQDAAALGQSPTVILLGDLIDRGPDSADVLDTMLHGGAGVRAILGNHERMMLTFADDPALARDWLGLGGFETLQSYGLALCQTDIPLPRRMQQMVAAHVPDAHLAWLRGLPHGYRLRIGGRDCVFAHAGLDAARPLGAQSEAAVLWGRNGAGAYPGLCVVQGHVIVAAPHITDALARIDTGAWKTGRLSAIRFAAGFAPSVLEFTAASAGKGSGAPSTQGQDHLG